MLMRNTVENREVKGRGNNWTKEFGRGRLERLRGIGAIYIISYGVVRKQKKAREGEGRERKMGQRGYGEGAVRVMAEGVVN